MTTGVPDRIKTEGGYAVIFTSVRTEQEEDEYAETARRMLSLAPQQPGFLGVESTRDANGFGITVSYWKDLEAIFTRRVRKCCTPCLLHRPIRLSLRR